MRVEEELTARTLAERTIELQQRLDCLLSTNPLRQASVLSLAEFEPKFQTFTAMFQSAVEEERDERLAYELMKRAFCEITNDPPIDIRHDLPAGLWEAMKWTAKVRAVREQLELTEAQARKLRASPRQPRQDSDDRGSAP